MTITDLAASESPVLRSGERYARVTLGAGADPVWPAVIAAAEGSNGFLIPLFTRAVAEQMRQHFDKEKAELARSAPWVMVDTLRWKGDVLIEVSGQWTTAGEELDEDSVDPPATHVVEPDERGLYAIGSTEWTWSEAD